EDEERSNAEPCPGNLGGEQPRGDRGSCLGLRELGHGSRSELGHPSGERKPRRIMNRIRRGVDPPSYFTLAPTTESHCLVMTPLAWACSSRVGNTAFE